MFSKKDIAEYYNTTQIHYEKWWDLKNGLSLHYGIWDEETKNFSQSLTNTNRILMELANIKDGEKILDVGCGVGGAAIFLSSNRNVQVTGISLSEKQVSFASKSAKEKELDDKVSFYLIDYSGTPFENETFDVVWACESLSSAPDISDPLKEAYRILKKGGRLILSDFFVTNENQPDLNNWIKKWEQTWSISNLVTSGFFISCLENLGYSVEKNIDYTDKILKSAKRMYYSALLGAGPSELYNFFHPSVTRFAKKHYMSGYYQYKALKENLWRYNIILAVK
jgi:ubiquinone/menaquinone biosynthesis C-methylase UbiE